MGQVAAKVNVVPCLVIFFRESDNSIRASDFQDLLARQGKQVLKFMSVPDMYHCWANMILYIVLEVL